MKEHTEGVGDSAANGVSGQRRRVRVLFGECLGDFDLLFSRDFLGERLLSRYDFEVVRVASGDDVLREVGTDTYDLIVLFLNNIIMPKDDPQDLLVSLVRMIKQQCGKPILTLCGAWQDTAFAEQVTAVGADFFFHIPCDAQEWNAAIECCLGGSGEI
jgi:DNA-binding response OmpR family regulator